MRNISSYRTMLLGLGLATAAGASAQLLRPANAPLIPLPWQGGSTVASLLTLHPDSVDGWDVQAIVEPVSPPVLVHLATRRGNAKEAGEASLLSFEARAVDGGRTYRVLLAADSSARRSDAKRLLLFGYRPDAGGRLRVEAQTRLDRLMREPGTTVEAGAETLFATALIPTEARHLTSGKDALATVYRNVLDTLREAPDRVVRDVTGALAQIPPSDSPVAPRIEGGSATRWIHAVFGTALAVLPKPTPLKRLRYEGLLASWDRPRLALAYLRELPGLLSAVGVEPSLMRRDFRLPQDVRDDQEFVGGLNLYEGIDADALFEVLWNSPLRLRTIDPRVTKAPSLANQRRVLEFLSAPEPWVRAEVYRSLAGWNTDWDRLKISNSRWSDAANGEVIENEASLRQYWENKLLGNRKP